MGQAVVDLPDPLDNPPPAPASSADDLLAQLAGDEIDRLLAESEGAPSPKPAATASTAEPTAAPPAHDPNQFNAEIDDLFNELTTGATAFPPGTAPSPPPAPTAAPAPLRAAETPPPPQPAAPAKLDSAASLAAEMALDEAISPRAHFTESPALHTVPLDRIDPLAQLPREDDLPVILKPFAWLSAPLDAFPDGLRDSLGKIAIITLLNAIAVLAYVLIFRKHG